MTDGPAELELKYRVDDAASAERLISASEIGAFVASAAARSAIFEDRYVDTAGGALERAGYAVRLRTTPRGQVVSVKALAASEGPGGSVRRDEFEGPADGALPAADWPPSDARALVIAHAGDAPLEERVTVRQVRRKRILRAGETRVELSLDEVQVVARERVVGRFTELEAELVKGPEDALAGLAAALAAETGLRHSKVSKLEAAMAAVAAPEGEVGAGDDGADADRLVLAKVAGVTADDHIAEAGRKVMHFHLARMLDHEAGTRSGLDMADVHKMRVATRRQRAAWRVFGSSYKAGRTKRYRDGLRALAARLGAVRDLDVQLEAIDAYRADLPVAEQRALEPLTGEWRRHREAARVLLLRELDSDGYRRFVDEYRDFVRTAGAQVLPVGPVEPHRVRDTAASRIWTAYEVVRGYEPVLRWADVETLHELRIAGKWLRYTLEFVREALGPGSTPLIARVTALQDHLGLMQDAEVTAAMARTFLVEQASRLSPLESAAIGRYLVDRERAVARLRRTIGPTWRGIASPTFRRTLGRVVAGL